MTRQENAEKLKQELILLYMRYFGSMMANEYKAFYADKDTETVLHSAQELFTEYAGESKGREIIDQLKGKYLAGEKS